MIVASSTSSKRWGLLTGVALLPMLLYKGVAATTIISDDNIGTTTTTTTTPYDFERMSGLVKRINAIEGTAPETLIGFYEPSLLSFSVKPGITEKRVCVTSTCYALLTICLTPGVYDSVISYQDDDDVAATKTIDEENFASAAITIPVGKVMETLLSSQLREDDLFQVPLVLYSMLRFEGDNKFQMNSVVTSDERIADRIRKMISVILRACPDPRLGARQSNSDYITYQICKVICLLYDALQQSPTTTTSTTTATTVLSKDKKQQKQQQVLGSIPNSILPSETRGKIHAALVTCAEVSSHGLCRQLAYHMAGDANSFDVIRLAYNLLTLIKSTEALSKSTGRELAPGEGPASDTKVPKINKKLVAAALRVFFEEQNRDGLWDKGQPIYKDFRRQGRNMGNAFVFSLNTLGSLLCLLPAEDFRPYLGALERSLHWIETHQTVEMITDYVDPVSGECYGKPIRGWCSPHESDDETIPQAWPTAQVLKCISWIKKRIEELMHNDVLEEFNGESFSNHGLTTTAWDQMLDSDLGDPTKGKCRTLKSVLEERVIIPFETSVDSPTYGAAYSAILFGPPGTAKTSICEELAKKMGWDFCVIDTTSFLADGLTNVASRIRYVFSRLMALNECIILFDEIEEFALDRETPGLSMESRMLTTAMLTAINDLRRNKRSVFFIATNRLRALDSAITRRGRFDMQLFVGTPNLSSRVIQFQQKLTSLPTLNKTDKKHALETYRTFLELKWSESAMFMNYLEGMQFATACANIMASERTDKAKEKEMSLILEQQAAVMAIRKSAREEYITSMELTRL